MPMSGEPKHAGALRKERTRVVSYINGEAYII